MFTFIKNCGMFFWDKFKYLICILYLLIFLFYLHINHIGGLVVSVHTSGVIDCVFEPQWVKPKTIKLVFAVSPLTTQHKGITTKTG